MKGGEENQEEEEKKSCGGKMKRGQRKMNARERDGEVGSNGFFLRYFNFAGLKVHPSCQPASLLPLFPFLSPARLTTELPAA